jgi:hypothetical protein
MNTVSVSLFSLDLRLLFHAGRLKPEAIKVPVALWMSTVSVSLFSPDLRLFALRQVFQEKLSILM